LAAPGFSFQLNALYMVIYGLDSSTMADVCYYVQLVITEILGMT
jgi:hypothetical protein